MFWEYPFGLHILPSWSWVQPNPTTAEPWSTKMSWFFFIIKGWFIIQNTTSLPQNTSRNWKVWQVKYCSCNPKSYSCWNGDTWFQIQCSNQTSISPNIPLKRFQEKYSTNNNQGHFPNSPGSWMQKLAHSQAIELLVVYPKASVSLPTPQRLRNSLHLHPFLPREERDQAPDPSFNPPRKNPVYWKPG